MIMEFQNYLTIENIYLWSNLALLPFWLLLIIVPQSRFTQIFVNSVIIPLILSSTYIYVTYQAFITEESFLDLFKLYLNLDNLYTIFSVESFLLIFWLHFICINIFIGSWMSRDALKYAIPKKLSFIPLIALYFVGPAGIVLYWFVRLFYAKKIGFHD